MLLCEVIVQHNICKHYEKHSAYEGAVQQDCELSLAHRRTASIFKRICLVYLRFMSKQGMVDEHRFFAREMYNASVRRMGLQILLQGIVSDWRVASKSGGDLDRAERWASVAADNHAHTYVTVILSILGQGCQ
jgi:hypothetical protein